jgi:hypothetical protein
MTDDQAQHVFVPLAQQITQTGDKDTLKKVGQALEAFAPKLTAVQARQAFDLVLRRIRQITDPAHRGIAPNLRGACKEAY